MSEQSSLHAYLNWAKERIDEMDAALASFEAKAGEAKADLKPKVDQLIVDLKKRRDEFHAALKTQAEVGEAAWARVEADMEAQWGTVSKLRSKPTSTPSASRSSSSRSRSRTSRPLKRRLGARRPTSCTTLLQKIAAGRRADVEAALKQMKSDASEADAGSRKSGRREASRGPS